jgi:hypothetical protein
MEVQTGLHARNNDAQTKGPNGRSSDVDVTMNVEIGVYVTKRESGRVALGVTFYKPCMEAGNLKPGDFVGVDGDLVNGLIIRKIMRMQPHRCCKVMKANQWGRIEIADFIADIGLTLESELQKPKRVARVVCSVTAGALHTPPLADVLRRQPPPAKRAFKSRRSPQKPSRRIGDVIGDMQEAIDLVNSYAAEDDAIRLEVADGRRLSMTYSYQGQANQ